MDSTDIIFERVWATLDRVGARLDSIGEKIEQSRAAAEQSRADFDKQMAESHANFVKQMAESRAASEKRRVEFEKEMKAIQESIKQNNKLIGSITTNNGLITEEYFFNSFKNGQTNFFGEKFDKIRKNKGGIEIDDEYDILLINGKTVGIVEVKFKAHENDLPEVLKKAGTFRINFPVYKNHKVYLGLASMAFYPELEQECMKQGIAIIKQTGNNVIINDKHLKAY